MGPEAIQLSRPIHIRKESCYLSFFFLNFFFSIIIINTYVSISTLLQGCINLVPGVLILVSPLLEGKRVDCQAAYVGAACEDFGLGLRGRIPYIKEKA